MSGMVSLRGKTLCLLPVAKSSVHQKLAASADDVVFENCRCTAISMFSRYACHLRRAAKMAWPVSAMLSVLLLHGLLLWAMHCLAGCAHAARGVGGTVHYCSLVHVFSSAPSPAAPGRLQSAKDSCVAHATGMATSLNGNISYGSKASNCYKPRPSKSATVGMCLKCREAGLLMEAPISVAHVVLELMA